MLDERKVFLREKHICFNCCASSTHVAKDCDRPVLCQECKIDKPSAVHLGPTPWKVDAYVSTVDHGGEQQLLQAIPSITSKCTEICGSGNTSNSCSKICLALVCPAGQRDRAMMTYIVLDEESNRFLGGTKFFEHFGIKDAGLRYTIKTFSGVMETREQLHDDIIRRNTHIPWPTLIECDMLPDDRVRQNTLTKSHPWTQTGPSFFSLGGTWYRCTKCGNNVMGCTTRRSPRGLTLDGW